LGIGNGLDDVFRSDIGGADEYETEKGLGLGGGGGGGAC
jgi:hypothetical protein